MWLAHTHVCMCTNFFLIWWSTCLVQRSRKRHNAPSLWFYKGNYVILVSAYHVITILSFVLAFFFKAHLIRSNKLVHQQSYCISSSICKRFWSEYVVFYEMLAIKCRWSLWPFRTIKKKVNWTNSVLHVEKNVVQVMAINYIFLYSPSRFYGCGLWILKIIWWWESRWLRRLKMACVAFHLRITRFIQML